MKCGHFQFLFAVSMVYFASALPIETSPPGLFDLNQELLLSDQQAHSFHPDHNANHHLSDQPAHSFLPDQNANHHLSDQPAHSFLPDQNANHHLSDQQAHSFLPDQNNKQLLPDQPKETGIEEVPSKSDSASDDKATGVPIPPKTNDNSDKDVEGQAAVKDLPAATTTTTAPTFESAKPADDKLVRNPENTKPASTETEDVKEITTIEMMADDSGSEDEKPLGHVKMSPKTVHTEMHKRA